MNWKCIYLYHQTAEALEKKQIYWTNNSVENVASIMFKESLARPNARSNRNLEGEVASMELLLCKEMP